MDKRWKKVAAAVLSATAILLSGCMPTQGERSAKQADLPQIVVGSDNYEPYNYIDKNGEFTGIDVDLAREAFHRMGYEPVFIKIDWENKDTYLAEGEVDCLWGCFTMTGREALYAWAGPYMCSRQVVVVRSDSGIEKLSDLAGKRIAVQATSKPETIWLDRTDARIPKPGWVYCFSTMNSLYAALRKDYVDAICGHENALNLFVQATPDAYRMLDESLFLSKLGVAFPKDYDADVVQKLTDTLHEMQQDGTTTQIIQQYGLDESQALEDIT